MTTQAIVGYSNHNAHVGGAMTRVQHEAEHVRIRRALAALPRADRLALVLYWQAARRSNVGAGDIVGYDDVIGLDEVGSLKSLLRKTKNTFKKISPVAKIAAIGLSFVAPPLGVAALAGITAADKLLAAAEGAQGMKLQRAARRVIANTAKAARAGHPSARGGWKTLVIAKRERKARPPALRNDATGTLRGVLVLRDGTIVKGTFRKAT